MSKTISTLEEAQAEIIRLNEELTERTNERDTLSQNNETLTADNESLRKLNQQYFNKLTAQYSDQGSENNEDDNEAPTCEEFAKTLSI